MNALLGLGTALAPVFAALFVGLGFWWGMPILVAILIAVLLATSVPLPLTMDAVAGPARGAQRRAPLPPRFWLFASFALLYGVVETMNGNWATLYMTRHLGASAAFASLALTVFWGTVTAGRVLFAALEPWMPARLVYCCLPPVSAGVLLFTAWLPRGDTALGLLSFAAGGAGLLRPAPAHDQLRPRGDDGHRRVGGGRPDRLLPDGLWHRGLRGLARCSTGGGLGLAPSSASPLCRPRPVRPVVQIVSRLGAPEPRPQASMG